MGDDKSLPEQLLAHKCEYDIRTIRRSGYARSVFHDTDNVEMAEAQGSSDELGVVEAAGSGKTSAMTRSTSAGSPVQAATRSLWSREAWDAPTQEAASRDFKFTQPPISR